ncbi:MAG: hypothetical protein LBK43_03130 [Treponema sp.]|nr:hypothetical protein [Treponema sp.]
MNIHDYFLIHQHYLQRYSIYEVNNLIVILDKANTQIKALITKAKGIETKKKYHRIAAEIHRLQQDLTEQLYRTFEVDGLELIIEEMQFVQKAVAAASDGKISILDTELPAAKKVWAAASFDSYSDDTYLEFKKYMDRLGEDVYQTWDSAVRTGYLLGTPSRQIVRDVLGSIPENDPGKMQKLRNSLEKNTHTMVASLAETARDAVYRENEQYFTGYQYVGTLDTRTCLVCGNRDGKRFKSLEGAPKLPAHHFCRCLYVPYIKGFEHIPGERAAMDGPVDDKLTYKDWLARQDPVIQEEILGKYRYQAYKNGVPVTFFVKNGNALTLDELRAKKVIPEKYQRVNKEKREIIQEQANQYFGKLTNNVKQAIGGYTNYYYTNINDALHRSIRMTDNIKAQVANIDIAVDGFEIKEDMTVFRGTNAAYYANWEAGSIKKIDAYTSTSLLRSNAQWFYKRQHKLGNDPIMLEIRVPAGTKGIYIGEKTDFKVNQAELLLNRGLSYKVIDKSIGYMLLEVVK